MLPLCRRGFAIAEVLLAAALLLYAAYAIFSVYSTSARFEEQNQHRALATVLGESLMDEAAAHTFGAEAPPSWGLDGKGLQGTWQTVSYEIWVQGRPVTAEFHVQWNLENGSFIGKGSGSQDLATFVISWSDAAVGRNPDYGTWSGTFHDKDNVHLVVQAPVWR